MEVVTINGNVREAKGKSNASATRKEGRIPAVIYGTDGNTHLTLDPMDMRPLVYTPQFKLAEVNVDGNAQKCIVKDVQFHPVTDEILHVDFLKLEDGRMVKVEVPVNITGVAPGVKVGGKLIKKLRKVKIKTLAENLISSMDLDVSTLELGSSRRVRDIAPVDGVQIMNAPGIPVASVEIPRALRSAQDAAAKAGGEEAGEEATEEATEE